MIFSVSVMSTDHGDYSKIYWGAVSENLDFNHCSHFQKQLLAKILASKVVIVSEVSL